MIIWLNKGCAAKFSKFLLASIVLFEASQKGHENAMGDVILNSDALSRWCRAQK